MNVFTKIPANVRQGIYVAVTLIVAALVVLGIVDKSVLENINETVGILGGIVLTLTTLMASFNVNRG